MIYIDMDGVIANFIGSALRVHQHEMDLADWPPGEWDIAKVIGITPDQFWSRIDQRFEHFWRLLNPYPWTFDLIESVAATGIPWAVLTSPSHSAACSQGKVQWLQMHFGTSFRDYILCPSQHKKRLAQPGAILIDDSDINCQEWQDAGGTSILFPQPWNAMHRMPYEHRVSYVTGNLVNGVAGELVGGESQA